jgi:4-amino-4-deoxy-L-arabinose transferase-like glycosyltransferase
VSLAALAAVLAGAAGVRSWRLSLPGLTSDEAFSWRLAGYPAADIARRTAEDVHSPLFYLVLKAWLAVAGDSAAALRSLSVLLAVAAVAVLYGAVREAGGSRAGAMAGALVCALHPLQVQQARNARMYALGVLLAALTAWLLLRALRRGRWPWWVAYGLGAALFVYAHYYALFTLAGQALGALALARDRGRSLARGLAVAAVAALAALAPWLPSLVAQARRVQAEYWIPPVSAGSLVTAVLRWATGLGAALPAWIALAAWLALAAWAVMRARGPALFFLAQALSPWLLALALSTWGGRPLFLERFTVFAQVALCGLLGVAWAALPRGPRTLAAVAIAGSVAWGLAGFLRDLPSEPTAAEPLLRYVRRWQQPGDVVVADSPRALNKLLFYARPLGLAVPVRALPGVAGGGHYTHLASLQPGELVQSVEEAAWGPRVWRATERPDPVPPPPAGWTMGFARVFEGGEGSRYLLVRYDRAR